MKLCTMGLGYIGLPTSIMFAKHGVEVVGVDLVPEIINQLNDGKIHIEEPGLQEFLTEVVKSGKFRASVAPEAADVFLIAVPTPNKKDVHRSCDLTHVLQAVKQILPFIQKGNTIIIESTIAPRSMEDQVAPLLEKAGYTIGEDLYVVHCPERVLPGQIFHELVYNNRVVGGITEACTNAGAAVYETFVKGEIIRTNASTAEMAKLMENTFRDVNIALANELAKICFELNINVLDVITMANKHPRVNIHQPGPGVGGHCLAVDPHFIVAEAPKAAKMIGLARETNRSMPQYIVDCVNMLLRHRQFPKIAIFGLSYKGNVDDLRESPAIEVINLLMKQKNIELTFHDPHVPVSKMPVVSAEEAVQKADLILLLTDHQEFKEMDLDILSQQMNGKMIFDTRNCIDPARFEQIQVVNLGNVHECKTSELVKKLLKAL